MLPVSEMPPVQLSPLLASTEKNIIDYSMKIKAKAIEATLKEVIHDTNFLSIPSKEALLQTSSNNPLLFDGIGSLRKTQLNLKKALKNKNLLLLHALMLLISIEIHHMIHI